MKNLKKVLALGLALVMLLGMFTVVATAEDKKVASDLTDWDSVEHKDAVSLMVDLGVIKGLEDGSFAPAGNIDRASWAKIVFYVANGNEDADAYLGTATGLKDIAGNWAESYISFLSANSIVSGDNNGNYNPGNNVSVAEACKTMLTVLGYDAEAEGYQNNAAWAGNIMRDASSIGLMDNVDSAMSALVPLTRENAAEIAMNALNANTVRGNVQWDGGERHVEGYSFRETLGYKVFKMMKVTAVVDSIDADGYAIFDKVVEPTSGYATAQLKSIKADASSVGTTVNVYVKATGAKWDASNGELNTNGTFDSVISSSIAKATDLPVKVITGGIPAWDNVKKRGNTNFVATEDNWVDEPAFYLNGNAKTEDQIKTPAKGRGTVVEFYANDKGEIAIVKVYEYTVATLTGDAQTKTLSDGTVQVRVPGVGTLGSWTSADLVSGWQGLVEDDVVLYYVTTVGDSKAYTIVKTDKVTGTVSTYNSSGVLTVNGTTYRAANSCTGGDIDTTLDNDTGTLNFNFTYTVNVDEFNFYLDPNGYVCYTEAIGETVDSSKVCMVLGTELVDPTLGSDSVVRAKLLFADGTTEIVTVTKLGGKALVDNVTKPSTQIKSSAALTSLTGDAKAAFYSWKSATNGYELTRLDHTTNNGKSWKDPVQVENIPGAGIEITQTGDFTGGKLGLTANASTNFIVGKQNANDGSYTYTTYKSFKNVPTMDAVVVTAMASADYPTVASYVYLETGAFKDDAPDGYIFITSKSWGVETALEDTYLVDIVDTDGAITTMRATEDLAKNQIGADSMKVNAERSWVGKFFKVTSIDENGVVDTDGLTEVKGANFENLASVTALGGDVVATETWSCDYDASTIFVYVDWGWKDTATTGTVGVRDADDEVAVESAGTFNPSNFMSAKELANVGEDGSSYESVMAVAVVPNDNSNIADYVYVIRTLAGNEPAAER